MFSVTISFAAAATDSRGRIVTILVSLVLKICATLIGSSHSEYHRNGVARGDNSLRAKNSLRTKSLVYKIPNVNGNGRVNRSMVGGLRGRPTIQHRIRSRISTA